MTIKRRAFLSALVGLPAVAQQGGPAALPHDMTNYLCAHYDDKACDQAPAPPPDYNPLVGTWVRYSLLRNGFTVQPPDAPLYVKFNADGYWAMMEFPAGRPKVSKPIEQQTPPELFRRFDKLNGGWGNYSQNGMLNLRHHLAGLGPEGSGLSGMRERLQQVAGTLEREAGADGTRLRMRLPLRPRAGGATA